MWFIAVLGAVGAAALIVWLQAHDYFNDALSLLACVVPLVALFAVSGRIASFRWTPTFGMLAAVCFFLFFTAGLVQYWINGRSIGFAIAGPVDSALVRDTLISCSIVTCMLILGDRLGRGRQHIEQEPMPNVSTPILMLSQVLWALAVYGCLDVARSLGGIAAAAARLSLHDRNVSIETSGTLGMSLWATFALPSIVTLFLVALGNNRSKRLRVFAAGQALIVVGFGMTMFGSRLLLVLSVVALAFSYFKVRGRTPSFKSAVAVVLLILATSALVLGGRAEALKTTHDASILDTIGYSIFDVSVASQGSVDELRPVLGSIERGLTVLSAALPGSGARAADISQARIDVLVVQAIGSMAQANNSGLPPSLPTSLVLGFALPIGMFLALIVGTLLGLVTNWLSRLRKPLGVVLFGLWGAFLFNTFKGGDLLLDIGSEARRWVYILVIYLAIVAFTQRKELGSLETQKYRVHHSRISGSYPDVRGK